MSETHHPPKLANAKLPANISKLIDEAKGLYKNKLAYFAQTHKPPAFIVCAPGRVNVIGEHTDYNDGYCLPMAIDYQVIAYGTGFVHTGKGTGPTTIRLRMISCKKNDGDDTVEERKLTANALTPPDETTPKSWTNYVIGTIVQYIPDLPPEGCNLDLAIAFASDVPIGAGLSSSAALETATATFLECFMHDMAFSSSSSGDIKRERAIRCQKAENEWALSPCGIMDQYVSSAAEKNNCMLLDCQSLEVTQIPFKQADDTPAIVVANSNVTHEIADGEYGKRRRECADAVTTMQNVPLYHVLSLRDANLQDCEDAKEKMGDVIYRRAKHVVTENKRVLECKTALKMGLWDRVGALMNDSHASLKNDFDVSCEEVDLLVDTAQMFEGVYGSRITGGGFGGCTITLVKKDRVDELVEQLKSVYKAKFDKECDVFVTTASAGARVLAVDVDCKPH